MKNMFFSIRFVRRLLGISPKLTYLLQIKDGRFP